MNYVSAVFFVFTSHANKSWNARALDGKMLLSLVFYYSCKPISFERLDDVSKSP